MGCVALILVMGFIFCDSFLIVIVMLEFGSSFNLIV